MFINSSMVSLGQRAWLPHLGRWLALMGTWARGRMLRGCCKGHQMPGGLGMGSCCVELTPLRKASYFLIHSRPLKSCGVGRESSVVHRRQAKVLAQPRSLSLSGGWGAVLGRGLCLRVPKSRGKVAPMMGLVPLGSAPGSCGANTHVSLHFPPRDGWKRQRWGHGGPARDPPPEGGESFGGCCLGLASRLINIASSL